LTFHGFHNYSVLMEAELTALDDKISQLVQLTQKLRKDNSQLRQNLASVQSENKRLSEKVNTAKTRLEALLTQIPDGAE
jgi:cell division protein ZapB